MTMSWSRRIAGLVVAGGVLILLRAGSLTPLRTAPDGTAMLRLSWSARPERIEQCRRLSDAELAARPQHMRLRWECEGRFARYLLRVSVDGRVLAADTVRGGGLRSDRPMHVFREYAVIPGERRVTVSLRRIDAEVRPDSVADAATAAGTGAADRETREGQERRVRRAEALPALVRMDSTLTVAAQRVVLVTYSSIAHRFVIKRPAVLAFFTTEHTEETEGHDKSVGVKTAHHAKDCVALAGPPRSCTPLWPSGCSPCAPW
ncbi:MAG: hypothetical protein C0497_10395 [Gemmatimonas sp.]|nr:hypothetical protein [Gemmatimonas sp.]